jgi:hypothetical protein
LGAETLIGNSSLVDFTKGPQQNSRLPLDKAVLGRGQEAGPQNGTQGPLAEEQTAQLLLSIQLRL